MFSFFRKLFYSATPRSNSYAALEKVLGYRFKNMRLLETALTHGSYRFDCKGKCVDNERLEFLGDAVLGLLFADFVYKQYAESHEGILTILRSRVVNETGLAVVARKINLGQYIRLGHGERANGGRDRDSILGDTLEALFGAIYLDAGIDETGKIFIRLFKRQMQSLSDDVWEDNPKGKLQQVTQRLYRSSPTYAVLSEKGPSHARIFCVEVTSGDRKATGEGSNKQAAQVAAARNMLQALNEA